MVRRQRCERLAPRIGRLPRMATVYCDGLIALIGRRLISVYVSSQQCAVGYNVLGSASCCDGPLVSSVIQTRRPLS